MIGKTKVINNPVKQFHKKKFFFDAITFFEAITSTAYTHIE